MPQKKMFSDIGSTYVNESFVYIIIWNHKTYQWFPKSSSFSGSQPNTRNKSVLQKSHFSIKCFRSKQTESEFPNQLRKCTQYWSKPLPPNDFTNHCKNECLLSLKIQSFYLFSNPIQIKTQSWTPFWTHNTQISKYSTTL